MNRTLVSCVAATLFSTLGSAPACLADQADPTSPASDPAPVPPGSAAAPTTLGVPEVPAATAPADSESLVSDACRLFNASVNLAAANYEDFAYATAGNGNFVDYQDPTVGRTNVVGRTALRQAAAGALSASWPSVLS